MKTLTVRQNAYNEVIEWLESGADNATRPRPPEGLHDIAASEWWAGHDEAYAEFAQDDEEWSNVMSVSSLLLKATLVYAVSWLAYSATDPYIKVAAGVCGLLLIWKLWR